MTFCQNLQLSSLQPHDRTHMLVVLLRLKQGRSVCMTVAFVRGDQACDSGSFRVIHRSHKLNHDFPIFYSKFQYFIRKSQYFIQRTQSIQEKTRDVCLYDCMTRLFLSRFSQSCRRKPIFQYFIKKFQYLIPKSKILF